jgi:hypothetical protein
MGLEINKEPNDVPADPNPKVVGKRCKADQARREPIAADGRPVGGHVQFS